VRAKVGIDCVRVRSEQGYMIGEVVLSIIFGYVTFPLWSVSYIVRFEIPIRGMCYKLHLSNYSSFPVL